MNPRLLLLGTTVLLGTTALGNPPTFVGPPVSTALATAAWAAGVRCTGVEPAHPPEIRIEDKGGRGPYDGLAFTDASGLYAIDAGPTAGWSILSHEVGHAWAEGPKGFKEGIADLLSDCMSVTLRNPLNFDDRTTPCLDLMTWQNDALADPQERLDGYRQSYRLARSLNVTVPIAILATTTKPKETWDDLRDHLRPYVGSALNWWTQASPTDRTVSLTDDDGDGTPCMGEWLLHTDPAAWDTDDDGWWDGARSKMNEAPIGDADVVCNSDAKTVDPTQAHLAFGVWPQNDPWVKTAKAGSFVQIRMAGSGGLSMTVPEGCTYRHHLWLRGLDGPQREAVADAIGRLVTAAGLDAPTALAVNLNGTGFYFQDGLVSIPSELATALAQRGDLDLLAAFAIARVYLPSTADVNAVEAFARHLAGTPKDDSMWVAFDRDDLRAAVRSHSWTTAEMRRYPPRVFATKCAAKAPWSTTNDAGTNPKPNE